MHTAAPGYSTAEYAYGTEPNTFLAANFAHLPRRPDGKLRAYPASVEPVFKPQGCAAIQ